MQLLLQVLQRPGEFSDAVSELIICCKKAFAASIQLDFSAEDDSGCDGNPELMDVLVDTLLSLLPQSSVPLRSAIEQVRSAVTSLASGMACVNTMYLSVFSIPLFWH